MKKLNRHNFNSIQSHQNILDQYIKKSELQYKKFQKKQPYVLVKKKTYQNDRKTYSINANDDKEKKDNTKVNKRSSYKEKRMCLDWIEMNRHLAQQADHLEEEMFRFLKKNQPSQNSKRVRKHEKKITFFSTYKRSSNSISGNASKLNDIDRPCNNTISDYQDEDFPSRTCYQIENRIQQESERLNECHMADRANMVRQINFPKLQQLMSVFRESTKGDSIIKKNRKRHGRNGGLSEQRIENSNEGIAKTNQRNYEAKIMTNLSQDIAKILLKSNKYLADMEVKLEVQYKEAFNDVQLTWKDSSKLGNFGDEQIEKSDVDESINIIPCEREPSFQDNVMKYLLAIGLSKESNQFDTKNSNMKLENEKKWREMIPTEIQQLMHSFINDISQFISKEEKSRVPTNETNCAPSKTAMTKNNNKQCGSNNDSDFQGLFEQGQYKNTTETAYWTELSLLCHRILQSYQSIHDDYKTKVQQLIQTFERKCPFLKDGDDEFLLSQQSDNKNRTNREKYGGWSETDHLIFTKILSQVSSMIKSQSTLMSTRKQQTLIEHLSHEFVGERKKTIHDIKNHCIWWEASNTKHKMIKETKEVFRRRQLEVLDQAKSDIMDLRGRMFQNALTLTTRILNQAYQTEKHTYLKVLQIAKQEKEDIRNEALLKKQKQQEKENLRINQLKQERDFRSKEEVLEYKNFMQNVEQNRELEESKIRAQEYKRQMLMVEKNRERQVKIVYVRIIVYFYIVHCKKYRLLTYSNFIKQSYSKTRSAHRESNPT